MTLFSCNSRNEHKINKSLKEVDNEKLLYEKISLLGTIPFDISNSTAKELKNHLSSNEDDSLRTLLKADKIEFYRDAMNTKFKVDSVVVFEKHDYYVLYDVANRRDRFEKMIDRVYKSKTRMVDTNLYLIEK
jgi:hypothetical protein